MVVPPPEPPSGAKTVSADRWGVVDFLDADRKVVLRVPLAEWLPEAGLVGLIDLNPRECLDRTGMRALVADLGIPLDETASSDSLRTDTDSGSPPDRAVHRELPVWYNWVRGIGFLVWFIFLLVIPMTGNGSRWTVLTAAAGLLLVPGANLVVRCLLWSRVRKSDTSLADAEVITPSPEAGAGATYRFCDTAAIRVLPGDVVLTNTVGEERWIPRGSAHGVARVVRLLDPSSGSVLGVEFRDNRNAMRALLPWQWWFAGPQGPENWARLVGALGVPVSDEKTRGGLESGTTWQGYVMATDARKMSPMDAKEARRATGWHSSVIGSGEPIVVPIFSLLPLIGVTSSQAIGQVTGILAALTIAAELLPVLSLHLVSRVKLDRAIEPEPS
ncbi:hypothetical protein [Streptomyces coeruleorubidus]|uniref:hypothetical protein n=1 Tax=Streptomyces coeruleorubidus TaxID=116188 RepID=UPI0033C85A85